MHRSPSCTNQQHFISDKKDPLLFNRNKRERELFVWFLQKFPTGNLGKKGARVYFFRKKKVGVRVVCVGVRSRRGTLLYIIQLLYMLSFLVLMFVRGIILPVCKGR
jgi:hypothetical protein